MLARNFITTTASTIIGMAMSFVASVTLARLLGAELQGIYSLAILIPNTVYFLGALGLPTSHIIFAGKCPEKRGAIVFESFVFSAIISIIVLGFYVYLLTACPHWFERFRVAGTFNLFLASFLVFFELTLNNLRAGVLGANRIPVINVGTLTLPLSKLVLIGIFIWWLGLGVTGGITAQLGCLVVMTVYWAVATAVEVPVSIWKPDFGFFKKAFLFGVKVHLTNVAWYIAHTIDRYMIAYLMPHSNKALGCYSVASQFSILLWVLPESLQTVFLPHLSVARGDKVVLTAAVARVLCLALFPIIVVLTVAAPLIEVVFGHDYADSVAPFMWFLPGMFMLGVTRPFDSYLTHMEKPIYGVVNSWIGMLANTGLNLFLIPRMGISGAALALSVSTGIIALITVGCFKYETKVPLRCFMLCRDDFAVITSVAGKFIRRVVMRKW